VKNRKLLEQYDQYIQAFTQEIKGWEKAKNVAKQQLQQITSPPPPASPSKENRRKSTSSAASSSAAASSNRPAAQRRGDVELTSEDIDYLSQGAAATSEAIHANAEFEKLVRKLVTTVDELDRTETQLRAGTAHMDKTLSDIAGRLRQKAFVTIPGVDEPLDAFRSAFQ
jgi:hypothetical protein